MQLALILIGFFGAIYAIDVGICVHRLGADHFYHSTKSAGGWVCLSVYVGHFCVLLHFIGFRIVIEMSPSLARSLGGVTTKAEQQKVEAIYRECLNNLCQPLNTTVQEIRQLEAL